MDAYTSNRLKKEDMKNKEYFEDKHKDKINIINQSAYPFSIEIDKGCTYNYYGITKRELFAAMAMQGMMADPNVDNPITAASLAVRCADALINELNKQNETD